MAENAIADLAGELEQSRPDDGQIHRDLLADHLAYPQRVEDRTPSRVVLALDDGRLAVVQVLPGCPQAPHVLP
jgi:hypothetical protein